VAALDEGRKTVKDSIIIGPAFVRLKGGRWSLPESLTVAKWREAKQVALCGRGANRQLAFATALLEQAEDYGAPEDACLMPWLAEHVNLPKAQAAERGSP
jgi:hypothetical protein